MHDNPMATQGWTDEEEKIGWAIITGLHAHIHHSEQPTGWADLNGSQLRTILAAVREVIKVKEKTHA